MVDNSVFLKALPVVTEELIQLSVKRMDTATQHLKALAVEEAPSDTGVLRASMVSSVTREGDQIVGMVGNYIDYAPYVHQGTGIYAKEGAGRTTPWFYFVASGKYKGWHKTFGQKPDPFLERARDKGLSDIGRILGAK